MDAMQPGPNCAHQSPYE